MNTYLDYTNQSCEITLYESSKFVRIFFTAVFVSAVFIVPAATLIRLVLSAFNPL